MKEWLQIKNKIFRSSCHAISMVVLLSFRVKTIRISQKNKQINK